MKRSKTAAREYERLRQQVDLLQREIREGLDQHAPTRPDEINQEHVWLLEYYVDQLRDVADQLHHRGKHAEAKS